VHPSRRLPLLVVSPSYKEHDRPTGVALRAPAFSLAAAMAFSFLRRSSKEKIAVVTTEERHFCKSNRSQFVYVRLKLDSRTPEARSSGSKRLQALPDSATIPHQYSVDCPCLYHCYRACFPLWVRQPRALRWSAKASVYRPRTGRGGRHDTDHSHTPHHGERLHFLTRLRSISTSYQAMHHRSNADQAPDHRHY
jgi:hypothetical protein